MGQAQRAVNFISLAGSGEPTLHSQFGEVLTAVKGMKKYHCGLLANSTLLFLPEVRMAARLADVVKVTLSAWDQASFQNISRPHTDLKFENIVKGLQLFRDEFSGSIWMEVFIEPGINSEPHQVETIAALAKTIHPDRIHLLDARANP